MDWSTVRTYPNEAEAAVSAAVLETAEVPVRLASGAASPLMFGVSAFAVQVPVTRLAEANEVLGINQQSVIAAGPIPLSVSDREHYAEALTDIRRRRRLLSILFLGYIPAVMALAQLVRSVMTVVFGWMALVAVAGLRVEWARCPRCGNHFHSTVFWHNPWTRRCLHCRLHVRADEGTT